MVREQLKRKALEIERKKMMDSINERSTNGSSNYSSEVEEVEEVGVEEDSLEESPEDNDDDEVDGFVFSVYLTSKVTGGNSRQTFLSASSCE